MANLTDVFTLRTAVADSHENLLLLTSCDEIEAQRYSHTCLFLIENNYIVDKMIVDWQSSGSVCLGPKNFIVFGELGNYLIYNSGKLNEGNLWKEITGQHKSSVMRAGAVRSGQVWWVGFNGNSAMLNRKGQWTLVNQGLYGDFEGVVPMPENTFLAYGWNGRVAITKGTHWTEVDVPTNLILTNGCVCPDGRVILIGQNGIILRGGEGIWEILAEDETNQDLWGVVWFNGGLFVSTIQFIYRVEDDETLRPVQYTEEIPETCYHLVASETTMWSIGSKSLFQLKNNIWHNIVLPDPR